MFDPSATAVLPFIIASVLNALLAVLAWNRRTSWAAVWFFALAVTAFSWSTLALVTHLTDGLSGKLFWTAIRYVPVVILPVTWFLFSYSYARPRWRPSAGQLMLLFLLPAITAVAVATNRYHGIMFSRIWLNTDGPIATVALEYGRWFWVNLAYTYGLTMAGIAMIVISVVRSPRVQRGQAFLMILGAVAPVIVNVSYVSMPAAFNYLDPTPASFAISTGLFGIALFRYNLFDIRPVARSRVLERMNEGFVVLDAAGRVLDWNPAAAEMLGIARDEVAGHSVTEIGSVLLKAWNERGRSGAGAEDLVSSPDGERWLEWIVRPLAVGGFLSRRFGRGWLFLVHDITERTLAARELEDARDRALELSRMKSAFLANVNHELRTPLAGIIGIADVIQSEVGDAHREFIDLIALAGERLMTTLDTVLAVADIDSGRIDVNVTAVDVGQEIARVVSRVGAESRLKGIDIVTELPPGTIEVAVDPLRFAEVLRQVLDNAIKFTDYGVIRIRVEPSGDSVVVSISDSGCGISAEFLPHVFDAFRQEDDGSDRNQSGTGLGLRVARGLLERMDATIDVQSARGEGTTVTLKLPAYHAGARRGADLLAPDRAAVAGASRNGAADAQDAVIGTYWVPSPRLDQ